MRLGRVVGRVWATVKIDQLEGQRLLIIQPVDPKGSDTGQPLVAVDAVGAGEGQMVLTVMGSSARTTPELREVPTDAVIVGIIDSLHASGRNLDLEGI